MVDIAVSTFSRDDGRAFWYHFVTMLRNINGIVYLAIFMRTRPQMETYLGRALRRIMCCTDCLSQEETGDESNNATCGWIRACCRRSGAPEQKKERLEEDIVGGTTTFFPAPPTEEGSRRRESTTQSLATDTSGVESSIPVFHKEQVPSRKSLANGVSIEKGDGSNSIELQSANFLSDGDMTIDA